MGCSGFAPSGKSHIGGLVSASAQTGRGRLQNDPNAKPCKNRTPNMHYFAICPSGHCFARCFAFLGFAICPSGHCFAYLGCNVSCLFAFWSFCSRPGLSGGCICQSVCQASGLSHTGGSAVPVGTLCYAIVLPGRKSASRQNPARKADGPEALLRNIE